jgi:hypothetical protein
MAVRSTVGRHVIGMSLDGLGPTAESKKSNSRS